MALHPHQIVVEEMGNIVEHMLMAKQTHGELTRDMVRAVVILGEEYGEVAKGTLELGRPDGGLSGKRALLREELRDLISVALFMIYNLKLEEAEHEVRQAQAHLDRTRGAVGERGQGSGGQSSMPEAGSTVSSADGGGERGAYRDVGRVSTEDATVTHRVDESPHAAGTGRRDFYKPRDFGEGDKASDGADRRRYPGEASD